MFYHDEAYANTYLILGTSEDPYIEWECIDDRNLMLDCVTLEPPTTDDYVLAVPGDAFRFIIQYGESHLIEQMLLKGSIFARMSPDEKHELVEKLQALDYTTGFCGDGANDCGALKAADVGISLSEAEASVAAPFTSRVFEISCVLDVIKEGRSALVTSFACFKYMSLYSAIQFVTVSIMYSLGSNLGDFQFLWIDLFLIIPIAVFMGWAEPFPKLCVKRPTANLVSRKVLVPLMGEIFLLGFFQFLTWNLVKKEPWYSPPLRGGDDSEVQSSDNTALFIVSCFQYIFIAVILSVGPPYRQPISKNVPFLVTLVVTVLCTFIIMFLPIDSVFGEIMDLDYLSGQFKFTIVVIAVVNVLLSWAAEKWIFQNLSSLLQKIARIIGLPTKKVSNKRYKRILKNEEDLIKTV